MPEFWTESLLGTRGSFMLDLVSLAMAAILPLLGASILLARQRRKFRLHKWCQLVLGSALALTLIVFELDIRFVTDWQARAEPSPFFERGTWNIVWYCLIGHLAIAIPTALLWVVAIVGAMRHFPRPPAPTSYSRCHAVWGWLAASGMFLTATSGWLFYWLAFVAT